MHRNKEFDLRPLTLFIILLLTQSCSQTREVTVADSRGLEQVLSEKLHAGFLLLVWKRHKWAVEALLAERIQLHHYPGQTITWITADLYCGVVCSTTPRAEHTPGSSTTTDDNLNLRFYCLFLELYFACFWFLDNAQCFCFHPRPAGERISESQRDFLHLPSDQQQPVASDCGPAAEGSSQLSGWVFFC